MNTAEQSRLSFEAWSPSWRGQVLATPPMIAPARQFTYPMQIAGEEDALARGALQVEVHPAIRGSFLATCALGFKSSAMPTGIFACPDPDDLCAVAGGYAYLLNTMQPESCTHLGLKPVAEVVTLPLQKLLLFVGFHTMIAWGIKGVAWETARLSWEGIRLGAVENDTLHGYGWNMQTDREVSFIVDLLTGRHTGGGFQRHGLSG